MLFGTRATPPTSSTTAGSLSWLFLRLDDHVLPLISTLLLENEKSFAYYLMNHLQTEEVEACSDVITKMYDEDMISTIKILGRLVLFASH